ncbi:MAG: hypothetical protein M1819_005718 [Sarea resinae]|nr:MAG: hypothetical protein M1819_005718 [Sarea resinae]
MDWTAQLSDYHTTGHRWLKSRSIRSSHERKPPLSRWVKLVWIIVYVILPLLFFTNFVICATVVVSYTAFQKALIPLDFLISAGICYAFIIIVAFAGSLILLFCRRNSDATSKEDIESRLTGGRRGARQAGVESIGNDQPHAVTTAEANRWPDPLPDSLTYVPDDRRYREALLNRIPRRRSASTIGNLSQTTATSVTESSRNSISETSNRVPLRLSATTTGSFRQSGATSVAEYRGDPVPGINSPIPERRPQIEVTSLAEHSRNSVPGTNTRILAKYPAATTNHFSQPGMASITEHRRNPTPKANNQIAQRPPTTMTRQVPLDLRASEYSLNPLPEAVVIDGLPQIATYKWHQQGEPALQQTYQPTYSGPRTQFVPPSRAVTQTHFNHPNQPRSMTQASLSSGANSEYRHFEAEIENLNELRSIFARSPSNLSAVTNMWDEPYPTPEINPHTAAEAREEPTDIPKPCGK